MRFPRRTSVGQGPDRDPAASMALLEEVLDPPVGPGYHSAAEARREAGLPASSGFSTPLMFVTALVLGALVTVSAVTLRTPDPAAAEARAQIVERIEAAEAAGDATSARVEALRAEILALEQQQARADQGPGGERAITAAGLAAGAQAVTGPGVLVTLQDAPRPATGSPGSTTQPERVVARDVQFVVNGLWAAGAEALSVNGHRLTATSAIRSAGEAIIVDFRGLAPPYEIRAIGDPAQLAAEASSGTVGAYLTAVRTQHGLRSTVATQQDITIGPAERLTTRSSTVAGVPTTQENR